MLHDFLVLGALVVAFAAWITAHLTLAIGLARRSPWWRSPVAFVVAPLAPLWGWAAGMRVRSAVWLVAVVSYALVRLAAG